MPRLALVTIALARLLFAEDASNQDLQISKTDRMSFPDGGTLRMPKSIGELTIEGWDDPVIEITTIKSVKVKGDKRPKLDPKEFDRISVMAERKANDIVVATMFPKHETLLRPFTGLSDFELEYRIKVPRVAALVIDHQIGNVNIDSMTGDIHATDGMGQITIQLVPGTQYAIDARSKLGAINSDVTGQEKERIKFGHTFMTQGFAGSKKLYLRIGFGDITIFDTPVPAQK